MKKLGVFAVALTLFTGAATVGFAQGTDPAKSTSTTKKTTKKKKGKKKSTGKKSTATKST